MLKIAIGIILSAAAVFAVYATWAFRRGRRYQREVWDATMRLPWDLRVIALRQLISDGTLTTLKIRKSEVDHEIKRALEEKAQTEAAEKGMGRNAPPAVDH